MSLIPVSKETLANKRLKPVANLSVLANVPHCEVLGSEFSEVAANFPIFFVQKEGVFVPIALFVVAQGPNLFVDEQGRWDGLYLPAAFRRYPFTVANPNGAGSEQVLMVEEELLSDDEGELLFGSSGHPDLDPNSIVGRVVRFTAESAQHGQATRRLIDAIVAANLIVPASEAFGAPDGQPFLPGFFSVSEKKLNALPDATFLELRHSGALSLICLQLASLGQLARLQVRQAQRTGQPLSNSPAHVPGTAS